MCSSSRGSPEQGVVLEVQHPHAEVEAGTPVRVDLAQLVGAERCTLDRRTGCTVRRDRYLRLVIENLFFVDLDPVARRQRD